MSRKIQSDTPDKTWTVPKLKEFLKENNVKIPSKSLKDDLITLASSNTSLSSNFSPSRLQHLPKDILIETLLSLDTSSILQLCRTNTYMNDTICNNDAFWRRKYEHDFGPSPPGITSFKNAYMMNTLFVAGEFGLIKNTELTKIENIKVFKIAIGEFHMVLIDTQNNVWVRGSNYMGQLGVESEDLTVFTKIPYKAKDVACGQNHTLLITMDDHVIVSGSNDEGQLGLGHINVVNTFTEIPTIIAKHIFASSNSSFIIDQDNNVFVTGHNPRQKLGILSPQQGHYVSQFTQVPDFKAIWMACGEAHTLLIDDENRLWGSGSNAGGVLGLGEIGNTNHFIPIPNIRAKFVATGDFHTIVIDQDNYVHITGDNQVGQLGVQLRQQRSFIKLDMKAKYAACGPLHTVIINMDNNVWVSGNNLFSQLGVNPEKKLINHFTQVPRIKHVLLFVHGETPFY
jgi:alpha-tubulin suppressor-like RCC1 family protein